MDQALINEIEQSEVLAWKDMYDAAPPAFAERMLMYYKPICGGLTISLDALPLAHFNMSFGHGITQPFTQEVADEIMARYAGKRPRSFMILHHPQMQPPGCEQYLRHHGLEPVNGWERIYRTAGAQPQSIPNPDGLIIEPVSAADAPAWAEFICNAYTLPFREWLLAFHDRKGWHHYQARKGDKIVAVRSYFLTPYNWVWSGVEAPVPGVMTTNYNPDFLIWEHAINDLHAKGAQHYVADIEKISPTQEYEPYRVFPGIFGFSIPYTRMHYTHDIVR